MSNPPVDRAPAPTASAAPVEGPTCVLDALLDLKQEYVLEWETYLEAIARPFFSKGQAMGAINPHWDLDTTHIKPFTMRLRALAPFMAEGSFVILGERIPTAKGVHIVQTCKLVVERGIVVTQYPEIVWKAQQSAPANPQKKER